LQNPHDRIMTLPTRRVALALQFLPKKEQIESRSDRKKNEKEGRKEKRTMARAENS